jgi:hypothetical protein
MSIIDHAKSALLFQLLSEEVRGWTGKDRRPISAFLAFGDLKGSSGALLSRADMPIAIAAHMERHYSRGFGGV